jgi:hypothetical protein
MLPAEKALLWALIHDPAAAVTALGNVDAKDIQGLATATILEIARSLADFPPDSVPGTLLERLDQGEAALVRDVATESAAPARAARCWIPLRLRRYERELASLGARIERRPPEIDELLREKQDLHRRKMELDDLDARTVQDDRGAGNGTLVSS